jgi:hypothetical protein
MNCGLTGGLTVANTAGTGTATPQITATNSNAVSGSTCVRQRRIGRVPVANELVATMTQTANSSSSIERTYSQITTVVKTNTNGAENGAYEFNVIDAGTLTKYMDMDAIAGQKQVNMFKPLDMNGNQIVTSTGNLTITGGSTSGSGTLITASNGTANGAVEINAAGSGNGGVEIRTSGFGALSLTASGGTGVGNIRIVQTGTQNQTSIVMGSNFNAYWTNVTGTSGTGTNARFGCYSLAPHRMKALGYSTSDHLTANTSLAGLNGPYFGRATLVAGTVTVANASIGANDLIFLTPISSTANDGMLSVTTTPSTSFTIKSSNALDARVVNFMIVINSV